MVMEDKIYMDWLNKTTSVDSENDRIKISQLQKANRILTEKLNMQSEKEYTMVKENNGVTEMPSKSIEYGKIPTKKVKVGIRVAMAFNCGKCNSSLRNLKLSPTAVQ